MVGGLFWAMMLAVAVFAILKSAQKPDSNRKGAWALAFSFVAWIAASVFGALGGEKSQLVSIVFSLFLFTAVVIAIVLGILALIEIPRQQPRPKRTQAIWAIVLAAIMGASLLIGVFSAVLERSRADKELVAEHSKAGELREFPELNFRFRVPDDPWQELNAHKLNPVASVAVRRSDPEIYMILIAEKGGEGTTSEALDEISQANVEKSATNTDVKWEKPMKVNGLPGHGHRMDALLKGSKFTYVAWVLAYEGHLYQLITWGPASAADKIESEAQRLFKNFEVLREGSDHGD